MQDTIAYISNMQIPVNITWIYLPFARKGKQNHVLCNLFAICKKGKTKSCFMLFIWHLQQEGNKIMFYDIYLVFATRETKISFYVIYLAFATREKQNHVLCYLFDICNKGKPKSCFMLFILHLQQEGNKIMFYVIYLVFATRETKISFYVIYLAFATREKQNHVLCYLFDICNKGKPKSCFMLFVI